MSLLKIGEIAKATGLTVRTLHHYDDIGLLTPSQRSDAGYRLYTHEDLMQLQKIKSLQQLGFTLEEIRDLVHQATNSLSVIIKEHISNMSDNIKQQQLLLKKLQLISDKLDVQESPTIEQLTDTLKSIVMHEKYYTPEQMEKLAQRRKVVGEDAIKSAEDEWKTIFKALKKLQKDGESASCEQTQKLAMRSLRLINMFTGGESNIEYSLQNMLHDEGLKSINHSGIDINKALFDYFMQAMKIAKGG